MSPDVKPTRPYDSPRRREQAGATRRAILEAAERLFVQQGYVATPVSAIAREARVALKTVYAVFGTKSELLRALWNLRMRGDEEEVPIAERPWALEVFEEADPGRRLELVARNARIVRDRTSDVTEVVRQAAPADPQIAELWERFERELLERGMRPIAEGLERGEGLAVDVATATDILWTLVHPDVHHLLVRERGWSPERYEEWLAETLRGQLLRRA